MKRIFIVIFLASFAVSCGKAEQKQSSQTPSVKNTSQVEKKLEQLLKAAEQGDAQAQYTLGGMYADGKGVNEDYKEAVRWYRMAAEQGLAEAQFNLGMMYDNGQGVIEDDKEAARWYRMAAEQGFAEAQNNLGLMYANGEGVIEDYVEAYKWILLAGMNGENVTEMKEKLKEIMTATQIAESQRLAKEYVDQKKR